MVWSVSEDWGLGMQKNEVGRGSYAVAGCSAGAASAEQIFDLRVDNATVFGENTVVSE